jgi:hypothetical protein
MQPLQLPLTIRTAQADEVPHSNENVLRKIQERENALIVQGFVLKHNPSHDQVFRVFAEINVDNERLWTLFKSFILQLPGKVKLLYRHIDDEPLISEPMDKYQLLYELEPIAFELARDGFLEFGVIYQDETSFEEVYVKKAKYLQYWGMNEVRVRQILNDAGIYETAGLNFIDEYPLATEAIKVHYPNAAETDHIIKQLKACCDSL